jgi:cysteine desulfurase/selenocysteine lyase
MNHVDVASIREDFPALKLKRNCKPPIYFDNACTTLVPKQVIEAITEYYNEYPGCGEGRSQHWFSEEVSRRIEGDPQRGIIGSRQRIKEFINAGSEREIIFTYNTTHAINIVASGYRFQQGDLVLLGDKEHNSNLVPWLRLQQKDLIKVEFLGSRPNGEFDLEGLESKLEDGGVKLISIGFTSNLTGYTVPAKKIIKLAHDKGVKVLLDGAQTVPHKKVDVQELDADFLAFSVHKMCGPKGVGVLYCRKEFIEKKLGTDKSECYLIEPTLIGGGTVSDTTYQSYNLLEPPESFEAGVQNYPGHIGVGSAISYLEKIGMENISSYEVELNSFLTEELQRRYGDAGWLKIIGPKDPKKRGGILTFEIKRPNAVGIAEELSKRNNIMLRSGAFCVHSYLNKLYGEGWAMPSLPSEHRMFYRVSLYFYNTLHECQTFVESLDKIFEERSYI